MQQLHKCNIFGTRIDNLSKKEILDKVDYFLSQKNKFNRISTLNPEILLQAKHNKNLRDAINSAELNIADGIGIKFAFLRYGKTLNARYSGIDLMWDILKIANKQKYNIFLLANANGLSNWKQTRNAILKRFPDLHINGLDSNYSEFKIQNNISESDIVFVNFGAPEQELLLWNLKNKTSAKLGIGVGGAFDYITNQVPRAPKWLRKIGLEWLFRLIIQPKRIIRIFKAIIIFPVKVLFD